VAEREKNRQLNLKDLRSEILGEVEEQQEQPASEVTKPSKIDKDELSDIE
jgi:hypothetical protein